MEWEESHEPGGRVEAKLGGTAIVVQPAQHGASGAWRWEVQFADGMTQSGYARNSGDALEHAKKVAERFLT